MGNFIHYLHYSSAKIICATLLFLTGFGLAYTQNSEKAPQLTLNSVLVLEVKGAIGPATSGYILNGLEQAQTNGYKLLVIKLDTPGGLDSSMRDIIKGILSSKVPVAVYVSPGGARAASAGTYMLYASHIAAMAPATNLGAATPVQIGGMPGTKPKPETEKDPKKAADEKTTEDSAPTPKTAMERKITNDAAAYIRSLAELRNRNVAWAEDSVRKASSLSASEALEQNVIDVVANDVPDLLAQIHGRTVTLENDTITIDTQSVAIEVLEADWRTKFLSVITDPNIAYMLMLLGIYGLIYEFLNPGSLVPGVIGGISILLALFALQVLPINYAGLALMLLGIAFMISEAFIPSFGILGIGGIIAFSVGSVILLDEEGYSISIPMIVGNAIVSAVFFMWILGAIVRIRRKPPVSGMEEMLNEIGIAKESFEKEGYVEIHGETWRAISDSPIQQNQEIKVKSIQGLTLEIEPY